MSTAPAEAAAPRRRIEEMEVMAAKAKGVAPAPRFLEGLLAALEEIGVPKAHVTRESYG